MDSPTVKRSGAKGKRPTSYDVAKLAGVSQATVSLVLSHKGSQLGISAETEQRVVEAAKSLSYYPNSLVRSIQRGRSNIVGVYARDYRWSTRNSYWIEALGALHTSAADLEKELLIFSDRPNRSPEQQLERMLNGLVDGLVVQPGEDNSVLERLAASSLPLVCIGDPYPGVPSIVVDNVGGIETLVAHLIGKGHRSFGMINLERAVFGAPLVRQETFLRLMREHGLPDEPARICHCHSPQIPEAMAGLLRLDPRPTALLCFNDEWAYHALTYCVQHGICVPQDLAIAGFDGIPMPLVPMEATTVVSPIAEMCQLGIERLLKIIDGKQVEMETVLPVKLRVGETT